MQTTTTLFAILQNLLPDCPAPYEADIRSLLETLEGFEVIFAEGLDTPSTHLALLDTIEAAVDIVNEVGLCSAADAVSVHQEASLLESWLSFWAERQHEARANAHYA